MIDHISVQVADVEASAAFYTEVHQPRYWPDYHPGYYGVFLRDPDGHNVEAVFHDPSVGGGG